jgi:pyruvate/2-oxoglutarate dehydrogenase complex dihydrolipoamide dehydrogenase (E3) component
MPQDDAAAFSADRSTSEDHSFDVVVIGAGPAGENVPGRVVPAGLSCAVVEDDLVGGECSYWACIPSKALLRPVDVVAAASHVPGVPIPEVDAAAVLRRRDDMVSSYDDSGQVSWLDGVGATLVRGHGRLAGPRRVEITAADGSVVVLRARVAVVLATGSRASLPPVPGLAEAQPWTNREATGLTSVPERLVVIGGGVVAVEMAQAIKGLGAREVTLLVRGPRLLSRQEPFAGELVRESLEDMGITVLTEVSPAGVRRSGGTVTVSLDDGRDIEADEILVATGRRPATDDLGLETVGLTAGKPVDVDDALRARGVPDGWLYAVGDVNGRNPLTHMGKYQARIVADVILGDCGRGSDGARRATSDEGCVPQVIFTSPQVAAVGPTEEEARRDGRNVRAVEYDIGAVSGASLHAQGYRGRAKLVVDEDRHTVLGATFVGADVAELLHSATVAVAGEVTLEQLWHAVPSFPTISEVWLRLLEEYGL